MDVRTAMSVFNAIAGSPGLSFLKRLTNSATMCEASQALPPLPKRYNLFPSLKASAIMLDTFAIRGRWVLTNFSLTAALSAKASSIIFSIGLVYRQGLLSVNLLRDALPRSAGFSSMRCFAVKKGGVVDFVVV